MLTTIPTSGRFLLRLSIAVLVSGLPAAAAAPPSVTIARDGHGLTATLANGGTASIALNYSPGTNNVCADQHYAPCFEFHAEDGAMDVPISVTAGCTLIHPGAVDCPALGVTSVTIVVKNGGSVMTTCDSGICAGGQCFSGTTIHVEAGPDAVFSVKSDDGCVEDVVCAAGSGTVEADRMDRVGGCAYVERRRPLPRL
ncbi:MAG TPA: hypothetical protein VFX12_02905 [Vicinamibacterales bacterium]|nr:hypothetical protein [Vicinamibacterales bacterium]